MITYTNTHTHTHIFIYIYIYIYIYTKGLFENMAYSLKLLIIIEIFVPT